MADTPMYRVQSASPVAICAVAGAARQSAAMRLPGNSISTMSALATAAISDQCRRTIAFALARSCRPDSAG
jgi:hypothetical protein